MVDLEFVGDYRNPQPLTARQRELGFDGQSDGEFTFDDFLDIINPLQHIPLVSTLYREITGDEISPHARILGDTLFGGPSGFIAAAANAFYEEIAGEDLGETVMAFLGGEEDAAETQFAGGETPGDGEALAAGSNGQPDPAAALAPAMVMPAGAPLATAAGPAPGPAGMPPSQDPAMAGMLTGQDALNALFSDLRRTPAAGPAMPLPQRDTAMKSYPLPPRRGAAPQPLPAAPAAEAAPARAADGAEAATHPLILAQDASDADIAQRMMSALDKYRTMSRQGRPAEPADRAEEAQWRADPAPDDPWRFDPAVPAGGS